MRIATPRPLALAIVLAAGGTGCGGGCNLPPPPQSDTCTLAPGSPAPTVTGVEIGRRDGGGGFVPIEEDSVVQLVTGGQGADMVVAALRITGTGLGECVAQTTLLEQLDGDLISSEESPMVAHPAGVGAVVTGDLLLVHYGPYGQRVRIRAMVGAAASEVEFWAGERGEVDAARPDASADAGPDAATDAPPDA